jgi:flagellar biosynthesis protein FlhF
MYSDKMGATQFEIEGSSLEDCKAKLYAEYGGDYQIVSQKTSLKGGFLGFGQHEIIKVGYIRTPHAARTTPAADDKENFNRNRDDFLKQSGSAVTNTLQLAQLSKKLDQISQEMNEKLSTISEAAAVHEDHASIKKIQELLEANEFTPSYIKMISEKIRTEFSLEELDDFDKVQHAVIDWIGEQILIAKTPAYRPPHVIIVVGPTGVGKTTTIAKLAANLIIEANKKEVPVPAIKLITTDTMRMGATEQLKKYGEIMDVTVEKAERTDDVKALFNDYKSKLDYLFIDTSGYSPNDYENIGKMRATLDVPNLHADVYLAISASTKARDLEKIIQNYEPFNFRSIIITKCDETSCFGNVLSVLSEKKKEISWITDGQQVPRYIEQATPISFLTRLVDFTVDRKHIEEKFNSQEF